MDKPVVDLLTARQRAVLRFYLDTLGPSASTVGFHKAGWEGEIGGRPVPRREQAVAQVVLPLSGGGAAHFYGTLGDSTVESGKATDHEHQFVCIFDIQSDDIVAMLSHARVHHDLAAPLVAYSSFILDINSPMRLRGYTSVLVARADLLGPFHEHNSALLDGVPTQILALIPLEQYEWKVKTERGTDALFDHFRLCGRDLLGLRALLPT